METCVYLDEIERLEAEQNNGKTLDGYDILETKKLTLLESIEWEMENCGPTGMEFLYPLRIDKLKKDNKLVTRYYSVAYYMDIHANGMHLKRDLDALLPDPA